jgi:RNA polymerase sigma-54 factor
VAIGPRLDLRQTQSLVMTPQLQQAIRLLALSNLEIEAFIGEELERNPLLEAGAEEGEQSEANEIGDPEAAEPPALDEVVSNGGADEADLDIEPGNENLHQDSAADSLGLGDGLASPSSSSDEAFDFDRMAASEISLQEHLLAQAGAMLSGQDLLIADQIIAQIDETGYFLASLTELAQRLGVPLARVEQVLAEIQTFDPAGIGARSLSECLALQAKEANRYDPAMARLIDHLDYLAKGNLAALKRICEVDDEDLVDMIRELRAYDPKPGCRFCSGQAGDAIMPDVFVSRRSGKWVIELNNATLPRLLINRSYHAELAAGASDKKTSAWLSECLTNANWLIKALDQRARTIVKVTSEIVTQQEGFFLQGVAHLRPLTLRTVAEAIGMHESTISRVTSNKYLACDRGLFELKYFFTSGVQSADGGDAVSAEAVKSHIKTLIGAEEPDAILSDDQLVEMLRAKGFDIARRTVAKYREAMGIGSSVQRRRQKAIGRHAA